MAVVTAQDLHGSICAFSDDKAGSHHLQHLLSHASAEQVALSQMCRQYVIGCRDPDQEFEAAPQ